MPEFIGDIIDVTHFMSKIDIRGDDECHLWKSATRGRAKYGAYCITGRWGAPGAKYRGANSIMLELTLGRPLRPGYVACHECDTPRCCNPNHLWEGTQDDNVRDMVRKGRSLKGRKRTDDFKRKTSDAHQRRKRVKCADCELVTEGSGMSSHVRSTRHRGAVSE